MLALSSPTCCVRLAISFAIDWIICAWSGDETEAAGAAASVVACGAACAGADCKAAGSGGSAFTAVVSAAGACTGDPGLSKPHSDSRNFGVEFAMICFAASLFDCHAAAAPMQASNNNAANTRPTHWPPDRHWPGPSPIAVARNVVSTGGTGGVVATSVAGLTCGAGFWRAASRNRLETSSSPGTTRTRSEGTTSTSCGSSADFGFTVDCIGGPLVDPMTAARQPADDARVSDCHRLHPGLTKARRDSGEVEAAVDEGGGETPCLRRAPASS